MTVRLSTATRNALVAAVAAAVDAGSGPGTAKVYTGTAPANGDAAETGTLLVTVTLGDPAFGAPSNGVITATDPAAATAVANGTAGWFRLEDSTGANVYDGDVTQTGGGGDMQLATTAITSGLSVDITSLTVTMPAS